MQSKCHMKSKLFCLWTLFLSLLSPPFDLSALSLLMSSCFTNITDRMHRLEISCIFLVYRTNFFWSTNIANSSKLNPGTVIMSWDLTGTCYVWEDKAHLKKKPKEFMLLSCTVCLKQNQTWIGTNFSVYQRLDTELIFQYIKLKRYEV